MSPNAGSARLGGAITPIYAPSGIANLTKGRFQNSGDYSRRPNDCCHFADHVFLSADGRSLFSTAGNAAITCSQFRTGVGDIFVFLFRPGINCRRAQSGLHTQNRYRTGQTPWCGEVQS